MVKKSLGFIIIWLFGSYTLAQKDRFVSLELLGSGGLGSVNFEHQVMDKDAVDLYMRYGFSMAPIDKNNGTALIFPVMTHATFFKGSHKLDTGAGLSFTVTTKGSFFSRLPLCLGYRLQPEEKRFFFRVAYTPIVSYLFNFQWENWGGIGFGFKI